MKTALYSKLYTYNFKQLFEEKGYAFFTKGFYNLNIIGVRSNQNCKVTDSYDDYLILDYNAENCHKRQIYSITTEPGLYYMNKPLSAKGTAILVPGQYRGCYAIGKHKGKYEALVQVKPVKVYRDGNKDNVYDLDPSTIEEGSFGINIHRSHETIVRNNIGNYSAGCQVFNDPKDFQSFMRLVRKSKDIYGNSFTYTLLDEKDLK